MLKKIKKEILAYKLLLKSIPASIFTFFVLALVLMNLLANKSISLPWWIAFDCGYFISWLAFLTMDIITKHFGPKAATRITILAVLINLSICLLFFVVSLVHGVWGQAVVENGAIDNAINIAINKTFAGSWYVLLGSTIAMLVSAIVNNFSNWGIGKFFKKNPDTFLAYISRSYLSSMIAQFVDNLIFAFLVSYIFFQWSILQCFTSALTGVLFELLCQILFSPIGYRICQKWKRDNIGEVYFSHFNEA